MDNNNRKDEQNKKNNRNGIILCLVVAIGVFLVFSFMQRQVKSATNKEITYDRFLEMLEDGQVKSVVLTSNEIKITPVTQQNTIYKMTYYTGLINMDTGLVERLQKRFVGNWLYAVDIITSFLAFMGRTFLYLPYDEQRHRRNDGGWKKYRKDVCTKRDRSYVQRCGRSGRSNGFAQ